ncbi:hypothetical protein EX30DRAFT_368962 [Ascodesmis nigricans]|uniref:CPAF-like PDZ domain-containing protein n=1 Tax=Ascodesmis nigricans TaxID=341454 RepID=A0A4S2N3D9_9PEZI|nr:hypothetical protein EX30DRAFT_368962 [Ascodesmis nigricans]
MRIPIALVAILSLASAQRSIDPCTKLAIELTNSQKTEYPFYVPASSAIACLRAIPFDQPTALDTIQNVRRYISFYSAATYVEQQPTPELELPPVHINRTLDQIESKVRRSQYNNNFEFDRDVYNLFGSVKDGHFTYAPTCYSELFKWEHAYPLVQVASSPDKLPEIYTADVVSLGFDPVNIGDKVSKINGLPPSEFLEEMVKTDPEADWVDPDARYNELLAFLISGYWVKGNFAERSTYYPDPITIEFATGKKVEVEWVAKFLGAEVTGSWRDAESFYQLFCLQTQDKIDAVTKLRGVVLPASSEIPTKTASPMKTPLPTDDSDWSFVDAKADNIEAPTGADKSLPAIPAYITPPSPKKLRRRQLSSSEEAQSFYPASAAFIGTPGQEIGFYYLDSSTVVFIVTAFLEIQTKSNNFLTMFSTFITRTIQVAKSAGITRILIDVTGNGGGYASLGQDMARQLFPDSEKIFFGQNMRWNPVLSAMLLQGDETQINGSFFDIGHHLQPDGTDFNSMADMLGPVHRDGDYFTKISIPDEIETNEEMNDVLEQDYSGPDPFKQKNVVVVTSGMCGSTCALFVEALTAAGARTVVFGGRPRIGPMQAVGGITGAQVLEFNDISSWIARFLPNSWWKISDVPRPLKVRVKSATVNFRNSWRRDGMYLPIEWLYTPADWKLFYTEPMLRELRKVHEAARDVAWGGKKDASGGKYVPVNGLDGKGWKPGSGASGGVGWGSRSGTGWRSLGELIWWKMGRGEL